MPRTHNLVELIETIDDSVDVPTSFAADAGMPATTMVTIRFATNQTALLDLSRREGPVWLTVLRSLREEGTPPYVELDAAGRITRLLQPKLQPVVDIQPLDDGPDLRIEFLYSHAVHVLRRKQPQYAKFLALLREARRKKFSVWVTETLDKLEIIDVRPDNLKGAKAKPAGE